MPAGIKNRKSKLLRTAHEYCTSLVTSDLQFIVLRNEFLYIKN